MLCYINETDKNVFTCNNGASDVCIFITVLLPTG